MMYCRECGSEIAETVTFCPYCGISQKSPQAMGESADEKTIAVNQSDWAALAGNEIEPILKDFSIKKPAILPEPKVQFPEKPEINREFEPQQNITAESWTPKTDSVEIPARIIPDTDASMRISSETDDSLKLPLDKKPAENVPDQSFSNPLLEAFDEKAEIILKSQVELQRMIFVQNQRIIELLEKLLEKKS